MKNKFVQTKYKKNIKQQNKLFTETCTQRKPHIYVFEERTTMTNYKFQYYTH